MSVHDSFWVLRKESLEVDCLYFFEGGGPHILYVAVSVDYQFDLYKVLHLSGNEQV